MAIGNKLNHMALRVDISASCGIILGILNSVSKNKKNNARF